MDAPIRVSVTLEGEPAVGLKHELGLKPFEFYTPYRHDKFLMNYKELGCHIEY